MALYSIDMKVCATLYIKAENPAEAMQKAKQWEQLCLEAEGKDFSEVGFGSAALPDESFSPAMTVHGPWSSDVERVELVDDGVT